MTIEQINEILDQRRMWVGMAAKRVPKDVAEDAYQDALVQAIQATQPALNTRTYFTSILMNECNDYWRKRSSKAKSFVGGDRLIQMSVEEDKYLSLSAPLSDRVDHQMLLQEEEEQNEQRKRWLHSKVREFKNPHFQRVVHDYIRTGVDDHSNSTDHVRLWRATQRLREMARRSGLMRDSSPSTPSGRRSFRAA